MSDERHPSDETVLNNSPRAVLQRLESLQAAGVMNLPKGSYSAPTMPVEPTVSTAVPSQPAIQPAVQPLTSTPATRPVATQPVTPQPELQPSFVSMPVAAELVKAAASLEVLRQQVTGCTACGELASTRTQTVFGVGNPNARLCFMGEAPGADEDRLGEPFVGKAGQLLTKIIEACQMTRDEVYILNVLKCRPPGNRNPTPQEADACQPFLARQLELINPEYVCCLGAVAAQNFLKTDTPIGRLRGRVHEHQGLKVVCTYHPAYLLRNPSAKRSTWDDMKLLMREMGVEL